MIQISSAKQVIIIVLRDTRTKAVLEIKARRRSHRTTLRIIFLYEESQHTLFLEVLLEYFFLEFALQLSNIDPLFETDN